MKWFRQLLCRIYGHQWVVTEYKDMPISRDVFEALHGKIYHFQKGVTTLRIPREKVCRRCFELHRPDDWMNTSGLMKYDRDAAKLARTS